MNRNFWSAIAAALVVIAVLALGFRFLGSPATQRMIRSDETRLRDLAALAQQINRTWSESGKVLPRDLDHVATSGLAKQDAVTGKPFLYHPKTGSEYELCATFAAKSPERDNLAGSDKWSHPQGDYCFALDAEKPLGTPPDY